MPKIYRHHLSVLLLEHKFHFIYDVTNKDSTDAAACIAVKVPHCDPSADPGPDRTCACVDQTDPPDTAPLLLAYLDPEACFCIGGYTQDPTDERFCTGKVDK